MTNSVTEDEPSEGNHQSEDPNHDRRVGDVSPTVVFCFAHEN